MGLCSLYKVMYHEFNEFLSKLIIDNLIIKIIREADLSDSWRSNFPRFFSDKSDKSVSLFLRIHVNVGKINNLIQLDEVS